MNRLDTLAAYLRRPTSATWHCRWTGCTCVCKPWRHRRRATAPPRQDAAGHVGAPVPPICPPCRHLDAAAALAQAAVARDAAAQADAPPALLALARRLGLDRFETNVLWLCVALELDASLPAVIAAAQQRRGGADLRAGLASVRRGQLGRVVAASAAAPLASAGDQPARRDRAHCRFAARRRAHRQCGQGAERGRCAPGCMDRPGSSSAPGVGPAAGERRAGTGRTGRRRPPMRRPWCNCWARTATAVRPLPARYARRLSRRLHRAAFESLAAGAGRTGNDGAPVASREPVAAAVSLRRSRRSRRRTTDRPGHVAGVAAGPGVRRPARYAAGTGSRKLPGRRAVADGQRAIPRLARSADRGRQPGRGRQPVEPLQPRPRPDCRSRRHRACTRTASLERVPRLLLRTPGSAGAAPGCQGALG